MAVNQPADAAQLRQIVLTYHERLYRLALLLAGDKRHAEQRVQRAFATVSSQAADLEQQLLQALLSPRPRHTRWTWQPDQAVHERVGLLPAQTKLLLQTLAAATPGARLALGLPLLLGLPRDAVVPPTAPPVKPTSDWMQQPTDAEELRCAVTRALGYVPADADPTLLRQVARFSADALPADDALAVRGALLTDDTTRALRDGLGRADELLRRALPALFAVPLAPDASAQLIETIVPSHQRERRVTRRLQLGLVGAVMLVVLVLFFASGTRQTVVNAPAQAATPQLAPDELVDRAIQRFEQSTPQQGVLHEQFVAALDDQRLLVERWYDYAPPHRLKVTVTREANDQLLFALATDGEKQIQYQAVSFRGSSETSGTDFELDAATIAALVPALRQQPDTLFVTAGDQTLQTATLGSFYLAQAHNADVTTLGATTISGRLAQTVAYRTAYPFPPERANVQPTPLPAQIVLTIDSETYTLLDVAVLPQGNGQSTVSRPWQASTVDVLAAVPAQRFVLPPADTRDTDDGLPIVRFLSFASVDQLMTLDQARRRTKLYLPTQLPAGVRGSVVQFDFDQDISVMFEGEFTLLAVQPVDDPTTFFDNVNITAGQQLGEVVYRLITDSNGPTNFSIGLVQPQGQENGYIVWFGHSYASDDERDAMLRDIVASMRPLTDTTLLEIAQYFSDAPQ